MVGQKRQHIKSFTTWTKTTFFKCFTRWIDITFLKGFTTWTKTTFYKVLPDNKNNILPEDKRGIELVRDKEADLVSGDGHGHQEVDLRRSTSPKFFDFRMRHGHVDQIKIFLEELEEEHEVFESCLLHIKKNVLLILIRFNCIAMSLWHEKKKNQ